MSTIKSKRFIARSNSTVHLLEEWKADHDRAMEAGDMEDLGQEFIAMFELLTTDWPSIEDSFFNGSCTLQAGNRFSKAIDASIDAADGLNEDMAKFGHEYHIDRIDDFVRLLDEARTIQKSAHRFWPSADIKLAEINAARNEFQAGRFVAVSELANEAQACDNAGAP